MTNNDTYELELSDVPPFHLEEQMPPAENYKAAVRFFWNTKGGWRSFWYDQARQWSLELNNFIGDYRDVHAAAAEAIGTATDPDEKIRRLYARAQEIRNLQWERERTRQEVKKEHLKENKSVVDVLKHGHGGDWDITALFVAMARSAGFDASMIIVAGREHRFFLTRVPEVAAIQLAHCRCERKWKEPAAGTGYPVLSVRLHTVDQHGDLRAEDGQKHWNFISMPTTGPDRALTLKIHPRHPRQRRLTSRAHHRHVSGVRSAGETAPVPWHRRGGTKPDCGR